MNWTGLWHTCSIVLSTCTMFLPARVVWAQAVPTSTPAAQSAADDPQPQYAARIAALLEELEQQRAESNVPGLGIAVVHGDEVLLCTGLGQADMENSVPAGCDTTFAIGSATKAFAATLIGLLVDDGVMDWDAHVHEYLPDFHLHDAHADAHVTIRDLLAHRTGLSRMSLLWAAGNYSREEILAAVVDAEPSHVFGTEFNYSNINYIAAGEASASAAEMSWEQLLQQRLLHPLGMDSATVTVEDARAQGGLAVGYMYDEIDEAFEVDPMRPIDAGAPAGAINASPRDMTRWLILQVNNGVIDGTRLISEENLLETRLKHVSMAPGMDYGLGWMLSEFDGYDVVEHGGNIDGFSAQVAFIPELDLGYVLLLNCSFSTLQAAANSVVFGTLLQNDTEDGTRHIDATQAKYAGVYIADFGPFDDAKWTVSETDDTLFVDIPGQMNFELKPPDDEGKRYFVMTNQIAVSFEENDAGEPIALVLHQGGLDIEVRREGVELEPEVTRADVQQYLGTYHFEQADRNLTVLMQNGRLALDVPGEIVYELHLPDDDGKWTFRAIDSFAVRFNTNDDGEVESLTMFQGDAEFQLQRTGSPEAKEIVTLDDVIALQQKAYGGEHLSSIDTMRITGTVRFVNQSVSGVMEILADGLTHYRSHLDLGRAGVITVTVAGDAGWTSSSFDPSDELKGKFLQAAQRQHPLLVAADWREIMDEVSLKETTQRDGRTVHIVNARLGEMINSTITIDAETGLVVHEKLVMMAPGLGALPMDVEYGNYRDVNGIMFPHRIESNNMWHGRTIVEFETIETNVALPDDAFAPPADM